MNGNFLHWRARTAWLALLLVPVLALAQNPFEGIYIGTFEGPLDDGEFAMIVDDRGRGMLAAYDALDDEAYLEKYIFLGTDGSFQFVTMHGTLIDGQATASGVSGRYFDAGTEGSFSGRRTATDGPLQDAAGYYSGPASITGTGFGGDIVINSRLMAVVAADGSAFFLLDRSFPGFTGIWPGSFDFDFDLDLGFGLDLDFGYNFYPPFHSGAGHCGPFNFGFDYSLSISIFGSVDLDFSFNRPTCSTSWQWNRFPWAWNRFPGTWNKFPETPGDSGGIIQIGPDGHIRGSLLDGLTLQGRLDPITASAEGILFQHQDTTNWSGHWLIERKESSSSQIAMQYARLPDMNSDGQADILWRHAVTGENAVWLMEGADIVAELPFEMPPDQHWSLVSVHELNDGQQPNLVWRDSQSGEIFVWFGGEATSISFELDPAWQIVGSGDFNLNARPELLVRHSGNGATALISDFAEQAIFEPFPEMDEPGWSPVAVSDFNGDSYADVLWLNQQTTDLLIWLMNGQTLAQQLYLAAPQSAQHELAGVGDFDGDGMTDILWRDFTSGLAMITVRPGTDDAEDIQLGANVTSEWRMAAVGDVDGDGTDDLVWRNSLTGENTVWRVVDSQVAEAVSLTPVPDLHWTIQP